MPSNVIPSLPTEIYGHTPSFTAIREDEEMSMRITIRLFGFVTLMGLVFLTNALAQQKGKFKATILPIQGNPIVVEDFTINGAHFYDAIKEGKQVKLSFQDLKSIRFLNPGKNFEAEVVFNNGRRDTYRLKPASNIVIRSRDGTVHMGHSKIARIEFGPPRKGQPQPATKPGTFDKVFLRNGDRLSGHVKTEAFTLHAPYGTFTLETSRISSIDFDAKGENVDVVMLKIGDRLSGALEEKPVTFVMSSGEEVQFEAKTIDKITFGR
jgi:hypothetical protein